MKAIELEKGILKLPARKRAMIVSRILESLNGASELTYAKVWGEEADARIAAYDSGKIRAKSAEQVLSYRGKQKK